MDGGSAVTTLVARGKPIAEMKLAARSKQTVCDNPVFITKLLLFYGTVRQAAPWLPNVTVPLTVDQMQTLLFSVQPVGTRSLHLLGFG